MAARLLYGRLMKTLLIVDDEVSTLFALDRYFTHAGYSVACATELEEAEALTAHRHFDLVVADISLTEGGFEGLELLRHLRRESPSTRVIVLTANESAFVDRETFQRGADALVRKPLPLPELARRAEALTGKVA